MTQIPLWQVDAFADELFSGNPAAVCVLDQPLSDETLLAIASENNLSETAYLIPRGDEYDLRWFTPTVEVELCGHATLASAHVVMNHLSSGRQSVTFHSLSGALVVSKTDEAYLMDLPARSIQRTEPPPGLFAALGAEPSEVYLTGENDYLCRFAAESDLTALNPDFGKLAQIDARGVCVTAPGNSLDFVSRFFAPASGVDEDPVTGSAHCALTPYWAEQLGKSELNARQLSIRGGLVKCELESDRVLLTGPCVTYLQGTIQIPA